jgi:hypothetical protein
MLFAVTVSRMKRAFVPGVLFLSLAGFLLHADDTAALVTPQQKSGFHLFNPTPRTLLRDLSTDRPDKTESPYTVDAGHLQVEMDLLSYSFDRYNQEHTRDETFGYASANFKIGLCNQADLQLVVPTHNRVRSHDRANGTVQNHTGFGDLVARLKMNFWGNDGGATAFAAMPFVKIPTSQDDLGNDAIEGGLILPLAVELPRGWGMGLMTELDFNQSSSGDHHFEFINSITFSHQVIGDLGGYFEFFSAVSAENSSDWIGTFDVGLVYALTENIQLDAGVNVGLTRAADDLNPFAGVTVRF